MHAEGVLPGLEANVYNSLIIANKVLTLVNDHYLIPTTWLLLTIQNILIPQAVTKSGKGGAQRKRRK